MQKVYFFILCFIPASVFAQIWQEVFDGLPNGSTSDAGATSWTTISPTGGAASFSKQTPYPGYQLMVANNTGTEGTWRSQVVDISSHSEVAIEIALYSYFTFSSDYIRCYYKIDGGPEIFFGELLGSNGLSIVSAASAIVRGNSLQIIIKARDNTPGTTGGVINGMGFDNITLSSITYLYSRSSGNWNNTNTWSTSGYSGSSCGCTPNQNTHVFIGNNRIVTLNTSAQTAGVSVENSGRINYAANHNLEIVRGGVLEVNSTGRLDKNANNGANISFETYNYSITVEGEVDVGNIDIGNNANITFSGNGSLFVGNDLLIGAGLGATIVNNILGTFSVGDEVVFEGTSSGLLFVNNGNMNIANRIVFNSDNVSFTNAGTLTAATGLIVNDSGDDGNILTNTGTLTMGAINLNNGDFTFNNSGIVDQSGNFSNVGAGSSINNLSGASWNYSGTTTISRLFTSSLGNTFNYNRSGGQTVIQPADGSYHHVAFLGSGTKSLAGNLIANGNISITENSSLDVTLSSYSSTVGGNWVVSSSHADPFVERSGTVIFNSSSNQLLSNSAGNEAFYNLSVNKSGGDLIQAAAPGTDVRITNVLLLTQGGLELNGNKLEIANSSPSAISRTGGFIKSEVSSFPYSKIIWSVGANSGAYVFPFGLTRDSKDYIPFTFAITSSGTGAGTVSVATYATGTNNQPLPSGVTNVHTNGTDNSDNVVDRFWQIDLAGYSTAPVSTITFSATPEEVGDIAELRAQRWNSSYWDLPLAGQTNPTLHCVTVPGVSSFSPWTLSGSSSLLPVNLSFFSARLKDDVVEVEWETHQELNNDYFTVEKTQDFQTFYEVAVVEGKGTSKGKNQYYVIDKEPLIGTSYYRLKQTDFDGRTEYFRPQIIEYNPENPFRLYPNPVTGSEFTIGSVEARDNVSIEILNAQGHCVYSSVVDLRNGKPFRIQLGSPLSAGTYLLRIGDRQMKFLVK